MGYLVRLGPQTFNANRDGSPITLPQAWAWAEGCRGVTILAPSGRVVLREAGSLLARAEHMARARRRNRRASL